MDNNQLSQIQIHNRVVKACFYSKIPRTAYNSIYQHLKSPYFYEQEVFEDLQRMPIVEKYLSQTVDEGNFMDVQEYEQMIKDQQPYQHLQSNFNTRCAFFSSNIMKSESSETQFPSRNSSVSSLTSQSQNSRNQVFNKKLKINGRDTTQNGNNVIKKNQIINQQKPTKKKRQVDNSVERRQRLSKINKIKEVGCNCKKSKCLKMYCQCFNLQILCGQNCNSIGCGNMSENENHHKSVLEALTRNPKPFAEDLSSIDSGFRLGVQLSEIRKGCKCRKTQSKKKYCECFNSGVGCGKFFQCEQCENNKVICKYKFIYFLTIYYQVKLLTQCFGQNQDYKIWGVEVKIRSCCSQKFETSTQYLNQIQISTIFLYFLAVFLLNAPPFYSYPSPSFYTTTFLQSQHLQFYPHLSPA